MILAVYNSTPTFPATDQNPAALRATVSPFIVDYTGTLPTLAEVQDVVTPPNTTPAAVQAQELINMNWHDVRCFVPVDVTTTLATFADITGLSFPIGANETWNAEFNLFCLGNTAGIKIQMVGPASPVRAVIGFDGNSTTVSLRTFNPKVSPAYGVPSIAYCVNATPFAGLVLAYLQIVNGPTAGVVKLQLASATAGQSTKVSAGSFGMARRAA